MLSYTTLRKYNITVKATSEEGDIRSMKIAQMECFATSDHERSVTPQRN